MARLTRVCPPGFPEHVIQRGNNKSICFHTDKDRYAYIHWLKIYSTKFKVDIHAWVLMSNHIHLLCTPKIENGISVMMQSIGRQYVGYFNKTHSRTGTLWEGRFKSCLVESESYLYNLYRYIEMNPVRACMVEHPKDYKWSSYQINALGTYSELCTPHCLYLQLGKSAQVRQQRYQQLFEHELSNNTLKEIRLAINFKQALGDVYFTEKMEKITGKRISAKLGGRPCKEGK